MVLRTQNVRFAEEDLQGIFGFEDLCIAPSSAEVPSAKKLEITELHSAPVAPACGPRRSQQVEVVADEPHDTRTDEAVQKVSAYEIVCRSVFCFSHVVKESGCPHHGIVGLATCELEDLKRVKERVALRMVAHRLGDAIEGMKKVTKLAVHLP
jgi:hypothetical protein